MSSPGGEQDDGVGPGRDEWGETSDDDDPPPRRHETEQEREEWQVFVRDLVTSVLAVLVVGAYLYAVSGVWPPLVAVESTSMTPNMKVNDLVFVMQPDRFPGPNAQGATGVVTARAGRQVDYQTFGRHGDVIVYERDGNGQRVPIIHRAILWVEKGENWYERADSDHITATECGESPGEGLANCPAPHAGFITKGDSNGRYDQVTGLSRPVKPGWVVGTAEVRVPNLGWIRLRSQAQPVSRATANRTDPGTGVSPQARRVACPRVAASYRNADAETGPSRSVPGRRPQKGSVVEACLDERLDVLDVTQPGVRVENRLSLLGRD